MNNNTGFCCPFVQCIADFEAVLFGPRVSSKLYIYAEWIHHIFARSRKHTCCLCVCGTLHIHTQCFYICFVLFCSVLGSTKLRWWSVGWPFCLLRHSNVTLLAWNLKIFNLILSNNESTPRRSGMYVDGDAYGIEHIWWIMLPSAEERWILGKHLISK